jgi:DNA primase
VYLNSFTDMCHSTFPKYGEALAYMRSRSLSLEDINKYGIGYTKLGSVPKSSSEDYQYLHDKTYGFKYLRERLIFPLRNMLGSVNGMVTRETNDKGRRYIVYLLQEAKKIGGFFGLYEALPHIMRTKKVFVHEGAIDVASFSKVFPNTVSCLTSFINEAQFETLDMLADKIILVYDNDKAGEYGVRKMKETYGASKIDSLSLGDGDANSYLQIKSPEEYKRFITSKIPFMMRD